MARVLLAAVFALSTFGVAASDAIQQDSAAAKINESSVNNIYQVSPTLYRSGQPSAAQMKELEAMGVKSILNLRQYNSDDAEAKGTGLRLFHIRMNAGRINDEGIIGALRTINEAPKPVLVHCWHGSDRTGAVVAMYRIVFQGWDKEAAIDELKQPQYGHHESIYANIPDYIRQADIEAIRKAVFDTH